MPWGISCDFRFLFPFYPLEVGECLIVRQLPWGIQRTPKQNSLRHVSWAWQCESAEVGGEWGKQLQMEWLQRELGSGMPSSGKLTPTTLLFILFIYSVTFKPHLVAVLGVVY